ncbi:STAS-like domain-containing protein [Prevotella pallens]|uniref:DUF4325 domain-containing protein n=1 Tax=Prevotella pallens TaxID=60133 RepID=A0A379GC83_9BACT|nr:STAS-like domain-containing protein [Prevotella pallens]SUC38133.1 Uncharacterised protein [Prevotella pallens]
MKEREVLWYQFKKDNISFIKECIRNQEKFIIDLDGTAGYGTSFLEEVFGGLIREEKLDYGAVCNTLVIISDEEPELKECWEYIKDAYEKS